VHLDFFFLFFTVEGKGVEVNVFFSFHWKCGRRRGEMGTFFSRNVLGFRVEWLGRGRGLIFRANSLWGEGSGLG